MECKSFLLSGLNSLKYRGYDSAGFAVLTGSDALVLARAKVRVSELEARVAEQGVQDNIGIAHTRLVTQCAWAECDAHPHMLGGLAVVYNGIIENHSELEELLQGVGYEYSSDTDTEATAHLVQSVMDGRLNYQADSLFGAVQVAFSCLTGDYALAMVSEQGPDTVVAARE